MAQGEGSNSKLVKIHNRALVLKYIQQNPGISRKAIADMSGLTAASITNIVSNLIEAQLVVEKQIDNQTTKTGRKPIGLHLNKEIFRVIAVEAGRNSISVGIFDLTGQILYREELFKGIYDIGFSKVQETICSLIKKILKTSNLHIENVLGIGMTAPGPIDDKNSKHSSIISNEDLSRYEAPYNWSHLHIIECLREEFKCPVYSDNSGNISALGESWFGEGRGISNFVQYTVGMGIGAGVIIDSQLYCGNNDVVSEVGHITIDFKGPKCSCGNIGCLELYGSFKNIPSHYKEYGGKAEIDCNTSDNREFIEQLNKIWTNAEQGEAAALLAIENISNILGIGAVSLANMFSPECIIVSTNDAGNIDPALLTPHIKQYIQKHAFSVIADQIDVIPSKLGDNIHLYGGVALVLQNALSQDSIFTIQ